MLASNAQSKNIHIVNNLNADYRVYADRRMVNSILLNLTTNAIKFTFPEGTVTYDAKTTMMCEDASESEACGRKYLEINITDTGVGISDEGLQKLFNVDDNYTLAGTSNEQGAGLGLILVKEMTEKQGGKLTISSQVGKGTVFTFTLPMAEI